LAGVWRVVAGIIVTPTDGVATLTITMIATTRALAGAEER
jgi:hypothetical protein